jgi:hypothetical protein
MALLQFLGADEEVGMPSRVKKEVTEIGCDVHGSRIVPRPQPCTSATARAPPTTTTTANTTVMNSSNFETGERLTQQKLRKESDFDAAESE